MQEIWELLADFVRRLFVRNALEPGGEVAIPEPRSESKEEEEKRFEREREAWMDSVDPDRLYGLFEDEEGSGGDARVTGTLASADNPTDTHAKTAIDPQDEAEAREQREFEEKGIGDVAWVRWGRGQYVKAEISYALDAPTELAIHVEMSDGSTFYLGTGTIWKPSPSICRVKRRSTAKCRSRYLSWSWARPTISFLKRRPPRTSNSWKVTHMRV